VDNGTKNNIKIEKYKNKEVLINKNLKK